MRVWSEVTNPTEIAQLNRRLWNTLRAASSPGGILRIGTPAGHSEDTVRFAPVRGGHELWIHSSTHRGKGDFTTLVGHRPSDPNTPLQIDLQFNFAKGQFNRRTGGVFIKDESGRPYLAHRGIITRGNSRVKKEQVFRYFSGRQITALSDVQPHRVTVFLVGALDEARLVERIFRFARAMREAATRAVSDTKQLDLQGTPQEAAPAGKMSTEKGLNLVLSAFREEFSGSRAVMRSGQVVMHWKHGEVVSALRAALDDQGQVLNCKAGDLIIVRPGWIDLYEVKRSSASQSIYTAIGQLVFNGSFLQQQYPSHRIRRFLVLPSSAKHKARQQRCIELGFRLITFEPSGRGYAFVGLPD